MREFTRKLRSPGLPLAVALLLLIAWPSQASATFLFFGASKSSTVEVDSGSSLKEAIEGGARHILLTQHIDARGIRGLTSSNSAFVLQNDLIIQVRFCTKHSTAYPHNRPTGFDFPLHVLCYQTLLH